MKATTKIVTNFGFLNSTVVERSPFGLFLVSRQSELSVNLNRQLERCLRNSKCIDTESLCVVSGEKVKHTHTQVCQPHRL